MVRYLSKVRANLDKLSKWVVKRIPHVENIQANALAGIVVTIPVKEVVLLPVYFQATSLIVATPVCNTNQISISWMNDIEAYIRTGKLPEDSKQAHKIQVQVFHFDRGQPL